MMYDTNETLTIKAMDVINENGVTIDELVEMTKLSKATISKFVRGKTVGGNTICTVWNKLNKNGYCKNYKHNGYSWEKVEEVK